MQIKERIIERIPASYELRVQELSQQILDQFDELGRLDAEIDKLKLQNKEKSEYIAEIERRLIEQIKLNKVLEADNHKLENKFIQERSEVDLLRYNIKRGNNETNIRQ